KMRVGAEGTTREGIANDDHGTRPGGGTIVGHKAAAQCRPHTQDFKIVAGSNGAGELLRVATAERGFEKRLVGEQTGQDVILVAISQVFGMREKRRFAVDIAVDLSMKKLIHGDYLLRGRNGEEAEGNAIENGEDADVEADAEGNDDDRGSTEPRVLREDPRGVAQVAEELLDGGEGPHSACDFFCAREVAEGAAGSVA